MIICISGDYRSGKSGFATHLSKSLNIPHFSMRKLTDNDKCKFNLNHVDWDKNLSFINDELIELKILDLAKKGNCILDFRFAALLCQKHKIDYIGIYIKANLESRIYGNMLCWKTDKKTTKKIIEEREKQELSKSFDIYNQSYKSSSLYGLYFDFSEKWMDASFMQTGFDYTNEILVVKDFIKELGDNYGKKY